MRGMDDLVFRLENWELLQIYGRPPHIVKKSVTPILQKNQMCLVCSEMEFNLNWKHFLK